MGTAWRGKSTPLSHTAHRTSEERWEAHVGTGPWDRKARATAFLPRVPNQPLSHRLPTLTAVSYTLSSGVISWRPPAGGASSVHSPPLAYSAPTHTPALHKVLTGAVLSVPRPPRPRLPTIPPWPRAGQKKQMSECRERSQRPVQIHSALEPESRVGSTAAPETCRA